MIVLEVGDIVVVVVVDAIDDNTGSACGFAIGVLGSCYLRLRHGSNVDLL